jgi:hypothetical protein
LIKYDGSLILTIFVRKKKKLFYEGTGMLGCLMHARWLDPLGHFLKEER